MTPIKTSAVVSEVILWEWLKDKNLVKETEAPFDVICTKPHIDDTLFPIFRPHDFKVGDEVKLTIMIEK